MRRHHSGVLDIERTVPPADTPIALADAKRQVRATEFDDDDVEIQDALDEAVEWLDGYGGVTGCALLTQTWELRLPSFGHGWNRCRGIWPFDLPRAPIELPLRPLQSVTSITYIDPQGVQQTLDPSAYVVLDGLKAEIRPAPLGWWPCVQIDNPRAVTITGVYGFGAAADVPKPFKRAIKLLLSHWHQNRDAVVGVDNRDSSTELPLGVRDMLAAAGFMTIP